MSRTRALLAAFLLFCPTGCGGQVQSEQGEPSPEEKDEKNGTPNGSKSGLPPGRIRLGECEPGFRRSEEPDKLCNWVFESLCYESKVEACACACPTQPNTSCSSGFPVEDGEVEVFCS